MQLNELFGFGKVKETDVKKGAEFTVKNKHGGKVFYSVDRDLGNGQFSVSITSTSGGFVNTRYTAASLTKEINDAKSKK